MKRLQHKIPPPIITLIIAFMMWGLHLLLPIQSINFSVFFYLGILSISHSAPNTLRKIILVRDRSQDYQR